MKLISEPKRERLIPMHLIGPPRTKRRTAPCSKLTLILLACCLASTGLRAASQPITGTGADRPKIIILDPPEQEFFSKVLYFHGIPIKSHMVVSNEALYAAYERLSLLFTNLLVKQPMIISNLVAAGAELHIIGRNQVTTDLPEWRHDKHVPLDEYNGLTRDRRTRGMGGLITSCGEENLLKLPQDRYLGRDICLHEFSHNVEGSGIPRSVREKFDEQYQKSKEKGLWLNSYAGSNPNEYFAELTMWYFGTHGDMRMTGPKPEDGPEGLKKYDPDAYALFDDFYSGRIEIAKVEPRFRFRGGGTNTFGGRAASGTNSFGGRIRRDSAVARAMVARLTSYKVGETKLAEFLADAGMSKPQDEGTNGWHVVRQDLPDAQPQGAGTATAPASPKDDFKFHVFYRNNANRDFSMADLEFKAGVLSNFVWNN